MKNLINKLSDDQKMWGMILGVSVVMSPIFAMYFGESLAHYLLKFGVAIFEMFLPGYVIYRLFFAGIELTQYRVMDRFIVSLALSILTVQLIAFVTEYITVFGLNEDQDERIRTENYKAPIIATLVIIGAFATKYYRSIMAAVKKRKS